MKEEYFYRVNIFNSLMLRNKSDEQSNDVYPLIGLKIDRSFDVQSLPAPALPEKDEIHLHRACLLAFYDLHKKAQTDDDFKDIAPFALSYDLEKCIRSFFTMKKVRENVKRAEANRIADQVDKIYQPIRISSLPDDEKIKKLKSRRKKHPRRHDDELTPSFNIEKMQELFREAIDDAISRKAFSRLIHIALHESYFGDDLDRHQIPGEVIEMSAESFLRFRDIKPKRGRAKIDFRFKEDVESCLEQIMHLTGRDKSKSRQDNTLKSSAIDVFVESWNKVSEICQGKDIIELDRIGPSKDDQVLGRLEKLEFRQVEAWFETRTPQKSPK